VARRFQLHEQPLAKALSYGQQQDAHNSANRAAGRPRANPPCGCAELGLHLDEGVRVRNHLADDCGVAPSGWLRIVASRPWASGAAQNRDQLASLAIIERIEAEQFAGAQHVRLKGMAVSMSRNANARLLGYLVRVEASRRASDRAGSGWRGRGNSYPRRGHCRARAIRQDFGFEGEVLALGQHSDAVVAKRAR